MQGQDLQNASACLISQLLGFPYNAALNETLSQHHMLVSQNRGSPVLCLCMVQNRETIAVFYHVQVEVWGVRGSC